MLRTILLARYGVSTGKCLPMFLRHCRHSKHRYIDTNRHGIVFFWNLAVCHPRCVCENWKGYVVAHNYVN